MVTIDIDQQVASEFEPIEVVLGGRTYVISRVSPKMMQSIASLDATSKDGEWAIQARLAKLLVCDVHDLDDVDARSQMVVSGAITKAVMDQVRDAQKKLGLVSASGDD